LIAPTQPSIWFSWSRQLVAQHLVAMAWQKEYQKTM